MAGIEKRERFKRLASSRTNQILKSLDILGNCANRSAYDYSEDDIQKIFSEIERRTREVKSKFHFSNRSRGKFKL